MLVKVIPIFTLLLAIISLCSIYQALILTVLYNEDFRFFSLDTSWGAFGFFADVPTAVLVYFFAGFFGSCGYVISLLFFSPVIVSASFLLEPFVD